MRQIHKLLCLICLIFLNACAGPTEPEHYAKETPALDLQQYFNGTLNAWGIFQNRSGDVIKRFTVVIQCSWAGQVGTLDEHFSYTDGTKQERIWTLRKVAPDRYVGTAPDVIGEAIGITGGNSLHWQYVLAVPVDGKIINFDFDDWMFLIDNHVMLNHAVMSKFGIKMGEVSLSFTKTP